MIVITPQQEKIIRALGHYKYLGVSQLSKAGCGFIEKMRQNVRKLRDLGLIDTIRFGGFGNHSKAEDMHFLTLKGARLLLEYDTMLSLPDIKFPKQTTSVFFNDYWHRHTFLNTQIAYHSWITTQEDCTPLFFDRYFDKFGNNRTPSPGVLGAVGGSDHLSGDGETSDDEPGSSKKTIKSATYMELPDGSHYSPDGLFAYEKSSGKKFLYLLEVYRGKDTQRTFSQLLKGLQATSEGVPSQKYGLTVANRILATFEHEGNLEAVRTRLRHDPWARTAEKFIFFGVDEVIQRHFPTGWRDITGKGVDLGGF